MKPTPHVEPFVLFTTQHGLRQNRITRVWRVVEWSTKHLRGQVVEVDPATYEPLPTPPDAAPVVIKQHRTKRDVTVIVDGEEKNAERWKPQLTPRLQPLAHLSLQDGLIELEKTRLEWIAYGIGLERGRPCK